MAPSPGEVRRFLEEARAAAREAGRIQLASYGKPVEVSHKGVIDLVTDVDHACEEAIVGRLGKAFPDHAILAEEGRLAAARSDFRWIIDPLDGTTNYAHGYPKFCVSIALEHRGRVLLGVVLDPVLGEEFGAVRGEGATLNGRPIHVSPCEDLLQALLSTGFAYDIRENPDNNVDYFTAFIMTAQAVRRDGAAALDLCYTAMGRFDGFWELELKPWDVAAGALIVREAGGRVTDFEGRDAEAEGARVVASNGRLHDVLLEIIRKVRAARGPG